MILEYRIDERTDSVSVRSFLKRQGLSTHLWRRLKHQGSLFINGEVISRATLATLRTGDLLRCEIPEVSAIEPQNIPLDVRYEDAYLLVVNKPAHMLVHPIAKEQHGTLANAVAYYYETKKEPCVFHPTHRLDRNTTGLVLIAKQPHIQSLLTDANGPRFHRTYLAIAHGQFVEKEGAIDLPLQRKPTSFIEQEAHADGKPALTRYRVLAETDAASLVELRPATGRTHQLRVHLAAVGHPILGDDLYGERSPLIDRQALHAFRLDLIHPVTQETLSINAPPPEDFLRVAEYYHFSI
ncbi:MAG: RluA family pseudouridine synthase [Schwartzia sp.]|nr:RluA family pseudouridine synthase [Schwartzia sp. (in: firmicutes)]